MDADAQVPVDKRHWYDFGNTDESNTLYDDMSVQDIAELCVLWRLIRMGQVKVN